MREIKICAILPAYNVEKTIGALIKKIKSEGIDVIVVDDGSIDNTAEVSLKNADLVLKHGVNKGKGIALRTGFSAALEKEYDEIITMDADGQHIAEEMPFLIRTLRNTDADIVVGDRLQSHEGMPFSRLIVNKLFSKIVSFAAKQRISDALNGFRIIKADVLKKIELNTARFDIDPEILIKAAKAGFKITSVKSSSIYAHERSNIRPWADGCRFFKLIGRLLS